MEMGPAGVEGDPGWEVQAGKLGEVEFQGNSERLEV